MRHFLSLKDAKKKDMEFLVKKGLEVKKDQEKYAQKLRGKNLLMLFEAPSLRTRLSFEIGMNQMGGHAIFYQLGESTLGKKESVQEFSRVVSRYANIIMARVYDQKLIEDMARYSSVPVINGMTNFEHPCQIMSDIMTLYEKKKTLRLKLAYLGDGLNNTTHSLLLGCSLLGLDIAVACPKGKEYEPMLSVVKEAIRNARESGSKVDIINDPREAVKDADAVYTDSWMSYHVPKEQEARRARTFLPYQVNKSLMAMAKKDAFFMHCLPAARGHEVTADVIESRSSIVIDQAENRLHLQKALMLWLLGKV